MNNLSKKEIDTYAKGTIGTITILIVFSILFFYIMNRNINATCRDSITTISWFSPGKVTCEHPSQILSIEKNVVTCRCLRAKAVEKDNALLPVPSPLQNIPFVVPSNDNHLYNLRF